MSYGTLTLDSIGKQMMCMDLEHMNLRTPDRNSIVDPLQLIYLWLRADVGGKKWSVQLSIQFLISFFCQI